MTKTRTLDERFRKVGYLMRIGFTLEEAGLAASAKTLGETMMEAARQTSRFGKIARKAFRRQMKRDLRRVRQERRFGPQ